jgi:hypothetical protein
MAGIWDKNREGYKFRKRKIKMGLSRGVLKYLILNLK